MSRAPVWISAFGDRDRVGALSFEAGTAASVARRDTRFRVARR